MARGPASSRSGTPRHLGLRSRRWKVCCPSRGGPKLMSPCQVSGLTSVPAPSSKTGFRCRYVAVSGQHVTELGDGQRPVAQRLAHSRPEVGPVRRGEPVVLHPARQLPLPPGRSEREVDAAVLGREVVHRPAERERLDHRPVRQRLRQLAGPRRSYGGSSRRARRGTRPSTAPHPAGVRRRPPTRIPTGSSRCRSNRQASAWLHVTEVSVRVVMSAASHRFRTTGVLCVLADPPSLSHDRDSAPSRLTSRHTGSPLLSTGWSRDRRSAPLCVKTQSAVGF